MKQAECESSRVLLLGATTYAGSRTSSPTTLTTALMTQARLGQNKTETGYMCNPHTVTAIYTSTCKYGTARQSCLTYAWVHVTYFAHTI